MLSNPNPVSVSTRPPFSNLPPNMNMNSMMGGGVSVSYVCAAVPVDRLLDASVRAHLRVCVRVQRWVSATVLTRFAKRVGLGFGFLCFLVLNFDTVCKTHAHRSSSMAMHAQELI